MNHASGTRNFGLLVLRLLAAAPLLLAGFVKVQGDAFAFSLSIDSFKLIPQALHLPIAYYLPWLELVLGVALLLGIWTRQAAVGAVILLGAFTLGLASVLIRGLDVDCGCFGGLFGDSTVSWFSILRNAVLILFPLGAAIMGGGSIALTRETPTANREQQAPPPTEPVSATPG